VRTLGEAKRRDAVIGYEFDEATDAEVNQAEGRLT
jgi:hypothetical protein